MLTKVRMIMMSHLSDCHEISGVAELVTDLNHKINFVKYLLLNYPDTNVEVDADEVYREFLTKFPNL